MNVSGIYGIICTANSKWYIGQSSNVMTRKIDHFTALKNGRHYNEHLQCAFVKYGMNNFEFRILEEVPEELLDTRERSWIAFYQSFHREHGYNCDNGGKANKHLTDETLHRMSKAQKGKQFSADHRRHISEARKGRKYKPLTIEHRNKISKSNKGKHFATLEMRQKQSEVQKGKHSQPCTDERRKKLSEILKGRKLTDEHCKNISEARKGMKFSADHCRNMSKVRIGRKGKPWSVIRRENYNRKKRIHAI